MGFTEFGANTGVSEFKETENKKETNGTKTGISSLFDKNSETYEMEKVSISQTPKEAKTNNLAWEKNPSKAKATECRKEKW